MRLHRAPLLLFLLVVGCATARHNAVVVDTALYESLNAVHALEQQALCGAPSCANVTARVTPEWTDAKSQDFNKKLLPAVEAGRALNTALAAWDPDDPAPKEIHALVGAFPEVLNAVALAFPESPRKSELLAQIGKAQNLALAILDIVITVRGGE